MARKTHVIHPKIWDPCLIGGLFFIRSVVSGWPWSPWNFTSVTCPLDWINGEQIFSNRRLELTYHEISLNNVEIKQRRDFDLEGLTYFGKSRKTDFKVFPRQRTQCDGICLYSHCAAVRFTPQCSQTIFAIFNFSAFRKVWHVKRLFGGIWAILLHFNWSKHV